MSNKNKHKREYRSPRLKARLSFNEGYLEKPVYSIKADTTEKKKGLDMIKLIQDNFNIYIEEIEWHRKCVRDEIIEEMKTLKKDVPKLHRDGQGRLASPFASKKKIVP